MKVSRARAARGNAPLRMTVLATLAVVAGAACGAPSKPPVALRVGVFSVQDFLPYFAMQERGFARRHGLRFEEKSYPGGAAVIEAMLAGEVDSSPVIGTVPLLAAAELGLVPGKVVSVAGGNFADREHPGVALLVGHSVREWKDLRGKHVAVNAMNSITAAAITGRLRQEGVEGFSLVEISFANMGLAVADGSVAGAGMNEPFLTQSLLRKDGKVLGWVVGGPPFDRMQVSAVVFTADFHRRNPEAVKAFLRAYLEAVVWIDRNPSAARDLLVKRLDVSKDVGRRMNLLRWPLDGRNDPALLDGMQPRLVKLGLLKAPVPIREVFDERLLDEVLREQQR